MSLMTPAGEKALAIAKWAWEDPAGRVAYATEQVRQMAADESDGDALREIQDAGTMLSRLAGTLDTEPVVGEDTILAQLAGGTLTSQLVDLAHWDVSKELRGKHGEWTKTGGAVKSAERSAKGNARLKRIQAAQARAGGSRPASLEEHIAGKVGSGGGTSSDDHIRQLIREELAKATANIPADVGPNKAAEVAFQVSGKAVPTKREELIHQQLIASKVQPLVESKAEEAVHKAQALVAQQTAKIKAQENTEEGRRRKGRLAIEGGLAITGGALTLLATKAGAPEVVPILASVGPYLLALILEFFKRY